MRLSSSSGGNVDGGRRVEFCCLGSSQTKLLLHGHRNEALMAALGLVAAVLEGVQGWVPARAQQESLGAGTFLQLCKVSACGSSVLRQATASHAN